MNIKSKSTLEKLSQSLSFKNYSDRTVNTYLYYAELFLKSFDKDIYHISQREAVEWLKSNYYSSISQQNQIISSVKALYKYVLNIKMNRFYIERPRKEKKLPQIIDKNHLITSINDIKNLKHKSILLCAYSVGLRVSEVVNLKIKDIDSDRMIITIRQAKGKKDRIVPLSKNLLETLRKYYRQYKPKEYLFNGQFSLQYTASSCNKIVKKYLGKNYHFHLLRHSSFTHMLENKNDISLIQRIAGHNRISSTQIYTHVSTKLLNTVELPI